MVRSKYMAKIVNATFEKKKKRKNCDSGRGKSGQMKHLPCLPYIYSSAPIYLRHICKEQICSICYSSRVSGYELSPFLGAADATITPLKQTVKRIKTSRLLISPLKIVHTFFILPKQSCRSWITSKPFKLWPPNLATFPKIYLETF